MKVISIKEPFATLIKDGVKIYETRAEMGAAAGKEISNCIKTLVYHQLLL